MSPLERAIRRRFSDALVIAPSVLASPVASLGYDFSTYSVSGLYSEVRRSLHSACVRAGECGACVCILPPEVPDQPGTTRAGVGLALAEFFSEQLRLGVPLVIVAADIFTQEAGDALAVDPESLLSHGRAVAERLQRSGIRLQSAEGDPLFVSGVPWEVEATDPTCERLFQLPGGEVFAEFRCEWSGSLALTFSLGHGSCHATVLLHRGSVISVTGDAAAGLRAMLLGRSLTEIGVGINPNVTLGPQPWCEKAFGRIHVGFGPTASTGLSLPWSHSDFLLAGATFPMQDHGDGVIEIPLP